MGAESTEDEVARLRAEVARLEAELAAERGLRHAVIDNSPDDILLCDLEGNLVFINRLAEGYPIEKVKGLHATLLAAPQCADAVRGAIATAIDKSEVASFESVAPAAYGRLTHFFNRVAPVREGEKITGVVMIAADIEPLRRAQEDLRERDDRLKIIVEASQMGVWSIDLDSRAVSLDDRADEIFGELDSPLTIESALAILPPEDRERVVEAIASAPRTGNYGPLEHRVVLKSGALRWVRTVGQVHRDADGVHRLTGGVTDITGSKRIEAELARAQRLDSIGRLAGGVAHDFNNLLTAMYGSIDLARTMLPDEAPAVEHLAEIRACAERGAKLTGQLLAFARRQLLEPRVMTLSALVLDAEKLLRRVLGEDITLTAVCGAQGRVRVDPHQIERVLLNLATNARDAMPKGGRLTLETSDVEFDEVYATTRAEVTPGRYVRLAVSDNGQGIEPVHMPHLFEPFFTTKGELDGTGLGLATCYGIVRQAGGHIDVYSEPGHGTTFRIHLPRVDEPVHSAAKAEVPVDVPGHETVLVVEDDAIVRRVIVRGLRRLGYRVLEASNGAEAIALATQHGAVDIVVTDVVMPVMSGHDFAERLRAVQPEVAVLFVSGYTASTILHHGVLDAGVEFLAKPFSTSVLHARIRALLDPK